MDAYPCAGRPWSHDSSSDAITGARYWQCRIGLNDGRAGRGLGVRQRDPSASASIVRFGA